MFGPQNDSLVLDRGFRRYLTAAPQSNDSALLDVYQPHVIIRATDTQSTADVQIRELDRHGRPSFIL